jgi:hypothetical protein
LKSVVKEGLDQAFGIDEGSSRVLAARGKIAGICILILVVKIALRIRDIMPNNRLQFKEERIDVINVRRSLERL